MKLKNGFYIRQIAGNTVAVPTGQELDNNMMITLNESGCLLWKALEAGAEMPDLVRTLTDHFKVDEATAAEHAAEFVDILKTNGFLQD